MPYSSQTEFPVGKSLNDVILQGLTGENWGFPKGYAERATSPFVRELDYRQPFTERDIQDVYSSRGLGRSTAVARDIGRSKQERDISVNQLLANAYMADIAQRKQDEANAIARGQTYSGQEVATRSGAGQFGLNQMQLENAANLENNALRRQFAQDETGALNRMIGTGVNLFSPAVGGAFERFGTGVGGDTGSFIKELGTGIRDTPKAFLKDTSTDQLSLLKLVLAGMK